MADPSGKSPSGAQEPPRRYYALFPPQGELLELYRRGELKAIIAFFQQEFAKAGFRHLAGTSFDVSLPAPRWRFVGDLPGKGDAAAGAAAPDVGKVAPGEFDLSRLLLAYEFDDPSWGPEFLAFLDKWLVGVEKPIVGVDLRFDLAEHWCPSEATSPIFGTRRDAGRLIGIEHLPDSGCTGERVNVVVVDQGLDAALTPNFGGGWISGGGPPGTTKRGPRRDGRPQRAARGAAGPHLRLPHRARPDRHRRPFHERRAGGGAADAARHRAAALSRLLARAMGLRQRLGACSAARRTRKGTTAPIRCIRSTC